MYKYAHTHIHVSMHIYRVCIYTCMCVHTEYLLLAASDKNQIFASHLKKKKKNP